MVLKSDKSIMKRDEKLVKDLIDKMFEIAEHAVTYEDIKGREDDWYVQWEMTEDQNQEWKDWGKEYLRKKGRMSKLSAEKTMSWIDLMYGLKIKRHDKENY